MKLRLQAGVERFNEAGARQARLTPIDRTVDVDETVGAILLLIAGQVDANDAQPGDGEVDFPLGEQFDDRLLSSPALAPFRAFLEPFVGGDWSAFVRVRSVS